MLFWCACVLPIYTISVNLLGVSQERLRINLIHRYSRSTNEQVLKNKDILDLLYKENIWYLREGTEFHAEKIY